MCPGFPLSGSYGPHLTAVSLGLSISLLSARLPFGPRPGGSASHGSWVLKSGHRAISRGRAGQRQMAAGLAGVRLSCRGGMEPSGESWRARAPEAVS